MDIKLTIIVFLLMWNIVNNSIVAYLLHKDLERIESLLEQAEE